MNTKGTFARQTSFSYIREEKKILIHTKQET